MSREEFLKILKQSLSADLDKSTINDQIDYYEKYIDDEIRKGRTEKEVIAELGDPRLIAKTIKTVSASESSNENSYNKTYSDRQESSYSESNYKGRSYSGYGNNNSRNGRSYMEFNGNNATIGCVIFLLVVFIIVYGVLSWLGRVAFSGPVEFLLVAGVLYLLFGKRK